MLFNITSKHVPTSARTAAQTSGCPANASARIPTLVVIDKSTFSITFCFALLASWIAFGSFRTSFDIKITFPVS
jgi:hypothetical protein